MERAGRGWTAAVCSTRSDTSLPDVLTRAEVVDGGAAEALLEASQSASLVVLGRRAPGHPMAAPRLGPVTHVVLHRAHVPVAVVPHD
ncbi:universal stress protein [Kitasatospora herbaricolor]|uniref:Universal stress protein n=1 Tax=Kitasatospora herbaricolor TaxID=68217 RepID=A0ABZ1W2D9_9ACTN|nr:universal stress protein [Kitasatospora herbaricolor]